MTNTERIEANNAELREAIEMAENLPEAKESVIEPLEITENGTYTAPDGVDGYSPITANVPIPDGYIKPIGTLDVTENGTHDVSEYAEVNVNVPSKEPILQEKTTTENGEVTPDEGCDGLSKVIVDVPTESGTAALDAFIEGATEITSNATLVAQNVFYSNRTLQKIHLPIATEIAESAFYYTRALTEVYAPEVLTIGRYAFMDSVLQKAEIPKATHLENGVFHRCSNLSSISCNNVIYMGNSAFTNTALTDVYAPKALQLADNALANNPSLQYIEVGPLTNKNYVYRNTFLNCPSLTALVIRATKLITLENVNAFEGTPIASGTGYIYIPSALIPNFQTATNWSTFANQFRALEDYTVDGTVTGEFDRSKS